MIELTIKGDVSVLHLQPCDKILVKIDGDIRLTMEMADGIRERVRAAFPDHEILVLAPGLDLVISREGDVDE